MRCEKDIVDKCKEEPKLFYRFINGKIKHEENITRLNENNEIYKDLEVMSVCQCIKSHKHYIFTQLH